ncbi:MAG: DUF3999 family protein [Crocinitomicaceae bacterium]|nr:DUF3999 family protein [Crocinitomicaceae bacterium]
MKKNSLLITFLFFQSLVFAQLSTYNYQRKLSGIENEWHRITLPDEIFNKVSPSLNDIRVYGVTDSKDTVEAPFFILTQQEEIVVETVKFELINTVKTAEGHYYTLKMNKGDIINSIDLDFGMTNYDWKIRLEGSHDEQEWFTVTDDYRVLSIQTEFTHYSFNRVLFPNASYTFYRVFVPAKENPEFIAPIVTLTKHIKGNMKSYPISSLKQSEDKEEKKSIVNVLLDQTVPISSIRIKSDAEYDYYRQITIESLYDSIKSNSGYLYLYKTVASGTFSSLEDNVFYLNNTMVKNLRITIQNQDNKPVQVSSVEFKGPVYELTARFTDPADYFIVYGKADCRAPVYDIDHFKSTIPKDLKALDVGQEAAIAKLTATDQEDSSPLFESKMWIWGIMCIAIVILGWFTFKMLRSEGAGTED